MLPVNEPPVATLKLAVVEPPCTTETDAGPAFSARVGNGVTVSAYVTDCVPVLSLPVMTILFTPAAMAEAAVAVTVAVVPGTIELGLILPDTPDGAVAVSETLLVPAPLSVTRSVKVVVLPASTVAPLAEAANPKSIAVLLPPPPHAPASAAASTEPRPVARLYCAPLAVNPVWPGTLLLPEGVTWNGLLLAFDSAYSEGFALPCPIPPLAWTTKAITPAKDGEAAEVPEIT
jgi:hypothetical protein